MKKLPDFVLDGIYSTAVVRDILERERRRGQRQITDPDLPRKIIMFPANNIGTAPPSHPSAIPS